MRATGVGPSIWSQIGVGVVVTGAFWLGLETGRGGESRESLVCACAERLKERVIRLKEKREE